LVWVQVPKEACHLPVVRLDLEAPSYPEAASVDPNLDPIQGEALLVQILWVPQVVQREVRIQVLVDRIHQVGAQNLWVDQTLL